MTTNSNAEILLGSGKRGTAALLAQGMNEGVVKRSEVESAALLDNMSAPGGILGLPPLLEKRRLSIPLIDQLFTIEAVYDKILVYQLSAIDMLEGTAGKNSLIMAPAMTSHREHAEAPRAIIISAGTDALDNLRSHGMDLGHIIIMQREAPYGIRVATVGGKKRILMILDAGDICGSEDLSFEMSAGRCESYYDTKENTHKYRDPRTGNAWSPEFVHEDREKVEKSSKKKAAVKSKSPRKRMGM